MTFLIDNEPQTLQETIPPSIHLFGKKLSMVRLNQSGITILGSWLIFLLEISLLDKNEYLKGEWRLMILLTSTRKICSQRLQTKESLDYFDTYSLVTKITSVRMLVALASIYKTSLNGEFENKFTCNNSRGLWNSKCENF